MSMKHKNLTRAIILFVWVVSLIPFQRSVSAAASVPPVDMFQLPWDLGVAWMAIDGIDNGSKRPSTSSHYYLNGGAIDFAPRSNMVTGEDTSNFWVTAAAPGTVQEVSSCHVKIAHDSGWVTEYQFLGKVQVKSGDLVARNQRLGIIADGVRYKYCTGYEEINIPHLHFMLRPSTVGATFAGWQVKYSSFWNSTSFTKGGTTVGLYKPLMNDFVAPTPTPSATNTAAPSATFTPTLAFTPTPNSSQATATAIAQQTATAGAGATQTAIAQGSGTPDPSQATATTVAQQTSTAGAGATQTANAQATPTPDSSQATSTAIAQQTSTAGAGATDTATAQAQPSSTPDPSQATATAGAQQTATAGARATSTAGAQASPTPDSSQATATAVAQTATADAGSTLTAIPQVSPTSTPSGPYVTTTLNTGNLYVGDKTLVTVTMHNTLLEGYASAEFTCTFDPALVETINYIVTNLFGTDPAVITVSPQAGTFVVGIAGSHGNKATTSGVAFTFEAKTLQAGQTTINCTTRISKGDGVLTPLPSTGSALVILGPGPSPTPALPSETPNPNGSPTPTSTPGTLGTLSGQVIAYKPVTINVYDTNNAVIASVPANADGTFAITIPAGTYWVVASAIGYLPAQGSFAVTGNIVTTLPTIALPAGDIDGNNVIDQFDALTVGMSYNTNVPSAADLNNDGVINVLDLDLLASNYRKTGPVVWQ